jgi:hypothetical protein
MKKYFLIFIFIGILGVSSSANTFVIGDINNDDKINLVEAIYALQIVAGTREAIAADEKIIIYKEIIAQNNEWKDLMTVPSGKVFVITDIMIRPYAVNTVAYILFSDGYSNPSITMSGENNLHLSSGIPFYADRAITVNAGVGSGTGNVNIMISGYLKSMSTYEKTISSQQIKTE